MPQSRSDYNIQVSLKKMNIKIEFKGKVHKLAPGLKSLEDLHSDVKLRYPACFKNGMVLAYVDEGKLNVLNTYEQLKQLAEKSAGASVRLRVFDGKELPTDLNELSNSQYSWRKESKDETGVFQVVPIEELKKIEEPFVVPEVSVIEHKVEQPEAHEPKKVEVPVIEVPPLDEKVDEPKPVVEEIVQPKPQEVQKPVEKVVGKSYACYMCNGIAKESVCPLCEGKGRIAEGHPLVAFIDELMNDRLQVLLEKHLKIKPVEEMKEEAKVEEKKPFEEKKQEAKPLEKPAEAKMEVPAIPENSYSRKSITGYSFAFAAPPQNKVKARYNEEFLWNLNISNDGSIAWPRRVYVYRIRKGGQPDSIFEIAGAMPGQKLDVTIGFRANRKDAVEMFELRMGYVDLYEGAVFFGPKFGFELDTREEVPIEKLRDSDEILRDKIMKAVRGIKHQRHSTVYILSQVRQLGVGDDISLEMLTDIIASLQ